MIPKRRRGCRSKTPPMTIDARKFSAAMANVVMITTGGRLSDFAAGFAVGAGAVLVISRARRPADAPEGDGGAE